MAQAGYWGVDWTKEGQNALRKLWLRFATSLGVMGSIVAFNAALVVVLWTVVIELVQTDRRETIRIAVERNDNLATAFEQYVIRTIATADAAVTYLIREHARRGAGLDLAEFVRVYTIDSAALTGVVLADEHGDALTTAGGGSNVSRLNIADREHFRTHIDRDDGKLIVGKPVVGRVTGRTGIPVTKRINKADGSFGGVAMALIAPERLTDILRDTQLSSLDVMSVIGLDGVTRARLTGTTASSGEDIRESPLFAEQAKSPRGHFFAKAALDGVQRLRSYRTVKDYGLVVTVGIAESKVLAGFHARQFRYFLAAGLTTALVAVFTLLLMRAEAALRANEVEQRRLARQVERERAQLVEAQAVANVGSWETELPSLRVTWSAQTYRIFEVDPASFQPTHQRVLGLVHPDDQEKVETAFADSMAKRAPSSIEHRIIVPDGRVKIVEERWTVFLDGEDQPVRATGTTQDISERKEAEQSLRDYAMRLQSTSRQLLAVQENERRLLATELHDTVGQELTALNLNLSLIRSALPVELIRKVGTHLDDSQSLLKATTQHLRHIMVELRPAGLDELGLLAALKEHAQREARRSNLRLTVNGIEPHPRFDAATEIALFRIVQEALNNITKHAQASEIVIELQEIRNLARLTVTDDGRGFDTARKPLIGAHGMGLTTIRERAEAIGGRCSIQSAPGKGTVISVELPRLARPLARGAPEI